MELRFKVNGYADWEARQHATNICHKIHWGAIDPEFDLDEQTKKLVAEHTSQKFKDVIPTRFEFYWIDKNSIPRKAAEQTSSSADDEEAPAITDETTTDIQKELSTGQKVPPRPTVKVPPKKKK